VDELFDKGVPSGAERAGNACDEMVDTIAALIEVLADGRANENGGNRPLGRCSGEFDCHSSTHAVPDQDRLLYAEFVDYPLRDADAGIECV
jgi:hypothetical protein